MVLHSLKYSSNVCIEAKTFRLSKSYTGRYILVYDALNDQLKLVDTFLDVERCLKMIDFPKNVATCLFYWVHHQIWHVMFSLQSFTFDKSLRQFYGKAFMDLDKDQMTLLDIYEIKINGRDLLYNSYQLDDGLSRYWIWFQRRHFEASRSIDIYKCNLTENERPERILSLKLDEFEQNLHVKMVTLIGQNCCYFLKSFGSMYLSEEEPRICFLEEFHFYDMKAGKHQVRRTRPFPNIDSDLDNFSIDPRHFWYGNRLHLLFQHKIWGRTVGNFMSKLLIFDADNLVWNELEFPMGDLMIQAKFVNLDSSGILTFRVQEERSSCYALYRCPLKQPEKLANLAWFKYKQRNNFCTSPAILDFLPDNFKFSIA